VGGPGDRLVTKSSLYCGNRRMPWPSGEDIPGIIQRMGNDEDLMNSVAGPNKVDSGKDYLRNLLILQQSYLEGTRLHLLELLELFSNRLCANPRDRIFSLLSLANEEDAVLNKGD
jgi:hypothetical protein